MIDWKTPLVEIERPPDAIEIQRAYKALCLQSIGLSGNPAQRAAFADLLAPRTLPGSDPKRIAGNAGSRNAILTLLKYVFSYALPINRRGISTCGMTCEGQDARMGTDAATLYQTYVWGTSVSRMISYYSACGAWTYASDADPSERPGVASPVVIGLTPPKGKTNDFGGVEHAFRIIEADPEQDIFVSADGGQVDNVTGLQCVKRVTRHWTIVRGHAWLVDPVKGTGRRVLGWGDPALLRFRPGVTAMVPQGWEVVDV